MYVHAENHHIWNFGSFDVGSKGSARLNGDCCTRILLAQKFRNSLQSLLSRQFIQKFRERERDSSANFRQLFLYCVYTVNYRDKLRSMIFSSRSFARIDTSISPKTSVSIRESCLLALVHVRAQSAGPGSGFCNIRDRCSLGVASRRSNLSRVTRVYGVSPKRVFNPTRPFITIFSRRPRILAPAIRDGSSFFSLVSDAGRTLEASIARTRWIRVSLRERDCGTPCIPGKARAFSARRSRNIEMPMEKLHSALRAGERAVPMPFVRIAVIVIKIVIKIDSAATGSPSASK